MEMLRPIEIKLKPRAFGAFAFDLIACHSPKFRILGDQLYTDSPLLGDTPCNLVGKKPRTYDRRNARGLTLVQATPASMVFLRCRFPRAGSDLPRLGREKRTNDTKPSHDTPRSNPRRLPRLFRFLN
jgi:hypothetical protein